MKATIELADNRLAVNYVSFGPEGAPTEKRFWTENIDMGEMHNLLGLFLRNHDEELRRFQWLIRPAAPRKRKRS